MEQNRAPTPAPHHSRPARPLVDSFVVAVQKSEQAEQARRPHVPVMPVRRAPLPPAVKFSPVKHTAQPSHAAHTPHVDHVTRLTPQSHAPHPTSTTTPKPKPRGISNVDGFVPVHRASTTLTPKPTIKPLHKPTSRRAFPEGPLHTKYLPREDQPDRVEAAPKPRGQRVIHPPSGAVPAVHPALHPTPKPFTPPPRMPVHKPGKSVRNDYQPTLDEVQAILAIDDEPTLRRPLGKVEQAKRAARLSAWAVVGLLVLGGLALFSQAVGEAAIGVYAIVAIWRRWPSQRTFALALGMFVGIIVTSLLSSANWSHASAFNGVSENLAVYAFLLLCAGTVSLALEVRADGRASAGPHSRGGIPLKRPKGHSGHHAAHR